MMLKQVVAILLPDGWHRVDRGTLTIGPDDGDLEATLLTWPDGDLRVAAPLTSIRAYKYVPVKAATIQTP